MFSDIFHEVYSRGRNLKGRQKSKVNTNASMCLPSFGGYFGEVNEDYLVFRSHFL